MCLIDDLLRCFNPQSSQLDRGKQVVVAVDSQGLDLLPCVVQETIESPDGVMCGANDLGPLARFWLLSNPTSHSSDLACFRVLQEEPGAEGR